MENMEDFCDSHNYTQRDLILLPLLLILLPALLLLPLYMYIQCFSELRRIILE
jgi:hypothetical protein